MAFYGKMYWPFKLVHGDFLDQAHRPEILESTIVFVNNFAFGPEVDQHLKDIFADLNDGARIFSSKSFCALNFRITERNLSGKANCKVHIYLLPLGKWAPAGGVEASSLGHQIIAPFASMGKRDFVRVCCRMANVR